MAAELNCARRTRIIVEDGKQILLRKENKKKKENGFGTPLVPKEDKKGLNEPQMTIFYLPPIRSVVKGMLEFRDIVDFHASARLSKIPRSSLSPCWQSAPVCSHVAET